MDNPSESYNNDNIGRQSWNRKHVMAAMFTTVLLLSLRFNLQKTTNLMYIMKVGYQEQPIAATTASDKAMEQLSAEVIPNHTMTSFRKNETLVPPKRSNEMTLTARNSSSISSSIPTISEDTSDQVVTVVAQLGGELGNQLQTIANGLCVQHHVEKHLGMRTKLLLRAQERPKWKRAMENTKEAFPNTRPFDFQAGNTEEFDTAHRIQVNWVEQLLSSNQLDLTNVQNPTMLNAQKCSTEQCFSDLMNLLNQTWHMERPTVPGGSTNVSIPHVYANDYVDTYCWEVMYDELKDFFKVDEQAICKQVPDPDETVFHFRNYLVEMPRVGKRLGFEEPDPNMTAKELFADYKPGDKVAIISRFDTHMDEYIRALKDIRGIDARYIQNQTGNQDFCFLLKAQKEIIGSRRSTFVSWAGFLGDAKRVRLCSLATAETRARGLDYLSYTFTNEKLRDRIFYENYNKTDYNIN
jgi:hypothetical protein